MPPWDLYKKQVARSAVSVALRKGELKKPSRCTDCKTELQLQGHHEDYDKPLDVIWLCQTCHTKRDRPKSPPKVPFKTLQPYSRKRGARKGAAS